jgi:hypothetical protein
MIGSETVGNLGAAGAADLGLRLAAAEQQNRKHFFFEKKKQKTSIDEGEKARNRVSYQPTKPLTLRPPTGMVGEGP